MKSFDRAVVWCLGRFVGDEALIGDLVQERGNGRSTFWLCRQAAAAIVLSIVSTARTRLMVSLTTLLAGYALVSCGTMLAAQLSPWFRGWTLRELADHPFRSPFLPRLWGLWVMDLAAFVPIAAMYVLGGWLVGRCNRTRHSLVLAFAGLILVKALATSTEAVVGLLAVNRMAVNPVLFVFVWTLLPTSFVLLGGVVGVGHSRVHRIL